MSRKEEKQLMIRAGVNQTLKDINKYINKLKSQQKNYIQKAREAKKCGNKINYNDCIQMIKYTFCQIQSYQIMETRVTFMLDQNDNMVLNNKFIKSIKDASNLILNVPLEKNTNMLSNFHKAMNKVDKSLFNSQSLMDEISLDNGNDDAELDDIINLLVDSSSVNDEAEIDNKLAELLSNHSEEKKKTN